MPNQQNEDLPVFIKWTEFPAWLLSTTEKFPQKVRFTFANRIDNLALDLVEDLVEARYAWEKRAILTRANLRLEKLRVLLRRKFKDPALLALLDHIIEHPIPAGVPGKGVPIGNLTSQYFANLYLGALDHFVKEHLHLKGYVRYMDDVLVFASNKPALHTALATLRSFLNSTLLLDLKDSATRLAPVTQGIPFLGFRIFPGLIRVDRKKWARLRRRIRQREAQYFCGMIAAERLGQSVASMIGHVRHADTLAARRRLFAEARFLG